MNHNFSFYKDGGENLERKEVVDKILHVRAWQKGCIRAPHKALLILYALAKFLVGQQQIAFGKVEIDLRNLLSDFGPPRRSHRPEYPFWRLQKDQVWEVTLSSPVIENKSGDVGRRALLDAVALGSFTKPVIDILSQNSAIVKDLIQELLTNNFPETVHADILQAIGVDLEEINICAGKRRRCPKFRDKVLQAYDYRCAVCGFDIRLGHTPIALEAAHIKWYQAGGPDTEDNGLALCALHHKLFDRGAFTLSENMEVLVSDKVTGYNGFAELLLQNNGKSVRAPQSTKYSPDINHISWHRNEVFHGKPRDV